MKAQTENLGSCGISSYTELRSKNRICIDKTGIIECLDESGTDHAMLHHPSGFGKTLLTTMLTAYYDEAAKGDFSKNFCRTYIGANPTAEQGRYRVLRFSLSGNGTFSRKVILGIRDYISRYPDDLFDNLNLSPEESPANLLNRFFDIFFRSKKVSLFVIIDDYDRFFTEALSQNEDISKRLTAAGDVKDFFTAIKAAAKHFVSRSFITGVMPVSLDSLTSGFNISEDLSRIPMTASALGFSEREVRTLIREMLGCHEDSSETDDLIRQMTDAYSGYRFCPRSQVTVFNPSMCLRYLTSLQNDCIEHDIAANPATVADPHEITRILSLAPPGMMRNIARKVLSGQPFALENGLIGEPIDVGAISPLTESNVISMLWHLGFLTYASSASGKLVCPNEIMRKQFRSVLSAESDFKPAAR